MSRGRGVIALGPPHIAEVLTGGSDAGAVPEALEPGQRFLARAAGARGVVLIACDATEVEVGVGNPMGIVEALPGG